MSRGKLIIHTIIVMLGAFMAILDTSIVDIVVPKMMAPLKTDLYGIQWVITSYMIAAAVALPLLEWISKAIGLRPVYILGVALFTLASYLCGISTELAQMVVFRSLQGFAEALIMVSAQAILFSIYPPEQRGVAMGIFGLGASFAPAVGPTLGGWLTEHLGWNWVFFINVPVGIFLVLLSLIFLEEVEKEKKLLPFNFISFFFISVGTVSTLVVLSKGQQHGWFTSNFIAFLTATAVISYLLYILVEIFSKNKLIDLSVFRHLNFTAAFLTFMLVLGFSMYQLFYAIPLYFEHLKGLSTLQTGILILPFAVAIGFFSVVAGALSDKWSAEKTLILAILIYFLGLYIIADVDFYTPKELFAKELIVIGTGMGLFFAPVTVIALRGLEEKTILVISLLDYIRFIGGSFGTAIATNILKGKTNFHYDEISVIQSLNYNFILQKIYEISRFLEATSSTLKEALLKAGYAVGTLQYKVAYSFAFQDLFVWAGVFSLLGIIPVLIYMLAERFKGVSD